MKSNPRPIHKRFWCTCISPKRGRGHPDSCVKHDSEVEVDQTVEEVVDSHVHNWSIFGSIMPNHLNMPKTKLWVL